MIRFPNFEGSIRPPVILERGESVYNDNMISSVEVSNGKWTARVKSESQRGVTYRVSVRIRNNKVTSHSCNCPYRQGPICKHRVALLYEIKNTGDDEEEDDEDEEEEEDDDDEVIEYVDSNDDEEDEDSSEDEPELTRPKAPLKLNKMPSMPNLSQKIDKEEDEEEIIGPNLVRRELECQVCLSVLHNPILLPCEAHSICKGCLEQLVAKKKKERDGCKHVSCPTCGDRAGLKKVKKIDDFKVNKELERIQKAYKAERTQWVDEKLKLESQLASTQAMTEDLRNNLTNATQNLLTQAEEIKKRDDEIKKKVDSQKNEEEKKEEEKKTPDETQADLEKKSPDSKTDPVEDITRKFRSLTTGQLKDVLTSALDQLKSRGENIDNFFKPKFEIQREPPKSVNTSMAIETSKSSMPIEKKVDEFKRGPTNFHIIKPPELGNKPISTNKLLRKSESMITVPIDELKNFLALKKVK